MRDRLIELLKRIDYVFDDNPKLVGNASEYVAGYLLANGVIALPCKVGDKVYVIDRGGVPQEMVFDTVDLRCTCPNEDNCMLGSLCCDKEHNICQYRFKNDLSDVGKRVFLTRQGAEQEGRKEDEGK